MLSRLRSSSVCRRAAFSSIATDSGSSTGSKFNFPRVKELGFETQWRNMNEAERDKVEKEHLELGKMDWHKLTFDQMRALYTIAYGAPELKDVNETKKVVFGVGAFLAGSLGLFAFLRSFAKPAPESMSPEGQEARRQYMLSQNANAIRGISSKKNQDSEDE